MVLVFCDAGIAQLVEHNLAMVRVASSNLVSRSRKKAGHLRVTFFLPFCPNPSKFPLYCFLYLKLKP